MTPIHYVRGDATDPAGDGAKIIAHVCNDVGGWGTGFVLAVSGRWQRPEAAYRAWHAAGAAGGFGLGAVQLVPVAPTTWVANMIGQHGIRATKAGPPIRYEALAECLRRLGDQALEMSAWVHMPRIGCGLAGGEWARIEPLVRKNLGERGVPVTVYDFG